MIAYMRMYPKGVPVQASNERVTRFSQEWSIWRGNKICCMILNKRIGVKDKETYSYYQWYLHAKNKLSRYVQGVNFSCRKRCIRDFAVITWKGGWDTRWGQREKSQPCPERSCLHNKCYWGSSGDFWTFWKDSWTFSWQIVLPHTPSHQSLRR